ncbi:unnamed protein product [Caenorhabditis bovis]|uniref:Uncharacterized protein n=1 Tax=Caenorhabditis bovis TaxID=2654633 RepID=A0A8S1F8W1_9PELO|nr:unnamed protein product [Caenorhabditis bovis]
MSDHMPIVVSRVTMEDNMFEPRPIPRITVEAVNPYVPRRSIVEKLRTPYIAVSVIAQLTLGILGNSLTLVADATRVFADHLEQFNYDRTATPGSRLTEIICVGITTIIIFLLFVAFLLTASTRAATMTFDINRIYLLFGTVLAMTSNTLQTLNHMKNWKQEPFRNSEESKYNYRLQIIHGFGYHFIAYFLLVSSLLILLSKDYLLADVITTYITSLLILANVSAIAFQLYNEYFSLEHPQDEYEPLQ